MTLDLDRLRDLRVEDDSVLYRRQEARLYALSVGFGSNSMDERELDFVTDLPSFKSVPSMATIFANVIMDLTRYCGLERPELALHGEQRLEIFKPLPDQAELSISGTIPAVYDRGAAKGAEIHMVAEARLNTEDKPVYRATYVTIARGDGGFGGPPPNRANSIRRTPSSQADKVWEFPIPNNQALIYALNGDPNPIHVEPKAARDAGFDQPLLHGLATYGMACRAVLAEYCDYDPTRMKSLDVRFSAPVFPGDTLTIQMWRLGEGVAFQATVRDAIVLKNGFSRVL